MWDMCRHWAHRRVPRGEFLDCGLTDEGVGLLRGEGCEILAQGSIGLIGYLSTSFNFFSGSSFEKNPEVKRAWLGAISEWMTDREVLPGCARVRIKCAEKISVGLWGQSRDPK